MRIIYVSDIHWDRYCPVERYSYDDPLITQKSLLSDVVSFANGDRDGVVADVFADVGDRITQRGFSSKGGRGIDQRNLGSVSAIFNQLNSKIRRVHLDGNHDGTLSAQENTELLGRHVGSQVIDKHESVRFVFWGASVRNNSVHEGYTASRDDLHYLKNALNTDKSVVLASHIPLDNATPVQYINDRGVTVPFNQPFYNNGDEIKDIILGVGNVAISMGGHLHRYVRLPVEPSRHPDASISNVQFLRLPSLTRPWTVGAAVALDVEENSLNVRVLGDYSAPPPESLQGQGPEEFSISLPSRDFG